jgi:hypothetical protein
LGAPVRNTVQPPADTASTTRKTKDCETLGSGTSRAKPSNTARKKAPTITVANSPRVEGCGLFSGFEWCDLLPPFMVIDYRPNCHK